MTLQDELHAIDTKDRGFYDRISDEDRKKLSGYIAMRWGATVSSITELEHYYLVSANTQANIHFFELGKAHRKLEWLLCTTISPGMGKQRHEFVKSKGRNTAASPTVALLCKLYPAAKMSDLELLAETISNEDLQKHLEDLGWDDKQIKQAINGK